MSSTHFSSKTFAQAAQIAEKIETLENQLSVLLQGANSIAEKQSTPKAALKRRISSPKKADPAAPKAAENGRGTLRPAVVSILKNSKRLRIYTMLLSPKGIRLLLKKQKKSLEFASTKC